MTTYRDYMLARLIYLPILLALLSGSLIDSKKWADNGTYEDFAQEDSNRLRLIDYHRGSPELIKRYNQPVFKQAPRLERQGWSVGCGHAPKRPTRAKRLIAAEDATYGEFPSFVRIFLGPKPGWPFRETREFAGVLISSNMVLTAATPWILADSIEGQKMRLHFGDIVRDRIDTTEKIVEMTAEADNVCTAKKYDHPSKVHNWKLIRLPYALKLNEYIQPACLPRDQGQDWWSSSLECYITGMGVAGFNAKFEGGWKAYRPFRLQKIQVERDEYCAPDLNIRQNDSSRVCYKRKDSPTVSGSLCHSDTGAPVLCKARDGRWTVAAIASYWESIYCGTNPHSARLEASKPPVYTAIERIVADMDAHCSRLLKKRPRNQPAYEAKA